MCKSDGSELIIYTECWLKLNTSKDKDEDKIIVTKLYMLKEEDTGPYGMSYLPWKETEKKFAKVDFNMKGNRLFIICYPAGINKYGRHIDCDKVYVCEPPEDVTEEQIQKILE